MLDGKCLWKETWNPEKGKFDNPGMLQAEAQKFRKHGAPYAAVGFSFFPFVGSCFGALGPAAVRYLWSLAWLEQRQNAATRSSPSGGRPVQTVCRPCRLCRLFKPGKTTENKT